MRIGLLGGSFNPAHHGHLHISLDALKRLGLDEVWWMVSPQNPLKQTDDMAPLTERIASCRALASHPRIRVTPIETQLGTQVTSATLKALKQRFSASRFVWLMGADNLAQFHHWNRWVSVMRAVPVAVFDRSPYSKEALASKAANRFAHRRVAASKGPALATRHPPAWMFVTLRRHPESSTRLRGAGVGTQD